MQLSSTTLVTSTMESVQDTVWFGSGIEVPQRLGTLPLTPTADERRHMSKSVFLTFSGGFKGSVSAPQEGLVTNINPAEILVILLEVSK